MTNLTKTQEDFAYRLIEQCIPDDVYPNITELVRDDEYVEITVWVDDGVFYPPVNWNVVKIDSCNGILVLEYFGVKYLVILIERSTEDKGTHNEEKVIEKNIETAK